MNLLMVASGGALGALMRLGLARFAQHITLPWGVFLINIVGSLALGILLGLQARQVVSDQLMFFLATGLLGAFTTFSTFSWENYQLLVRGQYGLLLLSSLGQVGLGIGAIALGRLLTAQTFFGQ
jgi:CrcB protein